VSGDPREQLGLDLDAVDAAPRRDEDEVGRDAGVACGREEVLPFGDEQLLVAATLKPADQLELRVVGAGDQALSLAALAASQIPANVSGSRTAMSARTLRSSSMPAACTPWMNCE
jgi:hypothetical protein